MGYMLEELKANLESKFQLTPNLWSEIADSAKQVNLKKDEVLIPYCSLKKVANIVVAGSLKQSLISSNGNKTATWFFFDNIFNVAICFDSYSLNEPTKYELVALENSLVFQINRNKIEGWAKKYPNFNKFYRRDCVESTFLTIEIRNHMVSHTPTEFIQYLKNNYPEIIAKVPSKYLAEFMGITLEWLSKINKTLATK